jgi:hypothetical protein
VAASRSRCGKAHQCGWLTSFLESGIGCWLFTSLLRRLGRSAEAGMAYDAATGTIVLFGGSVRAEATGSSDQTHFDDTWVWDGKTWTRVFPPVSPPARRFDTQGMAYDERTQTVVLFGGITGRQTALGDTWTWNGTTWTQRIVAALIFGPGPVDLSGASPWIDSRFMGPIEPMLESIEAQTHQRFIKSHLAADGLRFCDEAKYIVVGRDTRDVFMSLWNHYSAYTDLAYSLFNDADRPGRELLDRLSGAEFGGG